MAEKSALIIANYDFIHPGMRKLDAPFQDAEALAAVLADPEIGAFVVQKLINEPSNVVSYEIETFCENRKRDDLILIYFSGHGLKGEDSELFFASSDTQIVNDKVRRSTAVSARFVNEVMSRSRSRKQVLLIDCCYSGSFKRDMLAKAAGKKVGTGEQLSGTGRVVLTASDSVQYSFEGEHIEGEGILSVFTRALVYGLESGEADLDHDGQFSLDEIYEYVHDKVVQHSSGQNPTKMGYVEGKIFLGRNPRPKMGMLPTELQESIEHSLTWVRFGAVDELSRLLKSNNAGVALAARMALVKLVEQDDSFQIRSEASRRLADANPPIQISDRALIAGLRTFSDQEAEAKEKADQAEAERRAREEVEAKEKTDRAEAERRAREEAEAKEKTDRAEAERRAREEAAAKERADHAEAERRAREEAEAKEEADRAEAARRARQEAAAKERADHAEAKASKVFFIENISTRMEP